VKKNSVTVQAIGAPYSTQTSVWSTVLSTPKAKDGTSKYNN